MWLKDKKLYDIQLVLTLGLTKTEVCLCPDRNDNCSRFKPFKDHLFSIHLWLCDRNELMYWSP